MSIHDLSDGAHSVAASLDILARRQITLTIGEDMDEYQRLLAQYRPNQPLGAPFDPRLHDLTPRNCFWIVGRSPDGALVHTQAMRLIDLKGQTLAEYLRDSFRDFPPVLPDLDLARSRYRVGPGARMMAGRICYHGEFWFSPDQGAYRGNGLAGIMARFAFYEMIARWAPDYSIGFIANPVAYKGLATRQGYLHSEPAALRWARHGTEELLEGFMVYNSLEDMRYMLSLPVVDTAPVALAA